MVILPGMKIFLTAVCLLIGVLCSGYLLWLLASGALEAMLNMRDAADMKLLAMLTIGAIGGMVAGWWRLRRRTSPPA